MFGTDRYGKTLSISTTTTASTSTSTSAAAAAAGKTAHVELDDGRNPKASNSLFLNFVKADASD
jgi:hypothetical protein